MTQNPMADPTIYISMNEELNYLNVRLTCIFTYVIAVEIEAATPSIMPRGIYSVRKCERTDPS